jgi:hypothetical protein
VISAFIEVNAKIVERPSCFLFLRSFVNAKVRKRPSMAERLVVRSCVSAKIKKRPSLAGLGFALVQEREDQKRPSVAALLKKLM